MSEILVASGNLHKIKEMQAILAPHGIRLMAPHEIGGIPEVVEDGTSFAENAIKKALETARATGRKVLADDSGLEVEALGGEPGIYSSRYAGEGGNDGRNRPQALSCPSLELFRALS